MSSRRFIKNEQEIAQEAGVSDQLDPIRIFDLDSCGIDKERFFEQVGRTFEILEWDYYDVRRRQLEVIERELSDLTEQEHQLLRSYYLGEVDFDSLSPMIERLSERILAEVQSFLPFRKRCVSSFLLSLEGSHWNIQELSAKEYSQQVDQSDIRALPRQFLGLPSEFVSDRQFQSLLRSVAHMIHEIEQDVREMEVTCWNTSIVARPENEASNSPEGIHQDGADYIVSALVVNRENVRGGASRIFGPDKETKYLQYELGVGEGILQRDKNSSLWHDVTPIVTEDENIGDGVRSTIGFDIEIVRRA